MKLFCQDTDRIYLKWVLFYCCEYCLQKMRHFLQSCCVCECVGVCTPLISKLCVARVSHLYFSVVYYKITQPRHCDTIQLVQYMLFYSTSCTHNFGGLHSTRTIAPFNTPQLRILCVSKSHITYLRFFFSENKILERHYLCCDNNVIQNTKKRLIITGKRQKVKMLLQSQIGQS